MQIRQSLLRTATLLCPLQTLLHTSFFEFIRLLKGVWSKVRKGRSKVAVLYRLCLICIVNTIRIQLLKSESIVLSTHDNKIEFWTLPIRSSKHRWSLHHLLPHPQPIPTKHAFNPIRKKAISFSNYSIYYWVGFKKRINQKRNSLFPNRI